MDCNLLPFKSTSLWNTYSKRQVHERIGYYHVPMCGHWYMYAYSQFKLLVQQETINFKTRKVFIHK